MRSAFTGAFAPYICGLIEKKQALGYDYHGSACILRTFDEFCREQFPNETCLTAELAMKWAEQFKTEKNLSRLNRVSVIRELAKYMVKWQGGLVLKCQNEYIHTNLGIPVPCICIVPGCRLSSSRSSLGMPTSTQPGSMHGPILR